MSDIIRELYSKDFKIGCACAPVSERWKNNEIGNPEKEKVIIDNFNSVTFENELKPMYNMGYESEEATETFLPFVIYPLAKGMLDWVKKNNLKMRGHVLVWHSQCPKEVFCKGYKPVTIPTDPEILKEHPEMKRFEKLDPVCFVDRDTMLARMKSYIFNVMEYMYANGYGDIIYAWDVVNEAIELEDKTPTGLRNSYWYQVIGEDFLYYAFLYTRQAVDEKSKKYAANYGVDKEDDAALKLIQPVLFYNDYNEMAPDKKKAIIDMLLRETKEHGSIIGDGLLGGIGMQGHISDNNDIEQYMEALMEYSKYAKEVHITELDVKCTCTNINAEYYQAVFYKKFFEGLLEAKKNGANLTSVTFWGLTDDNSWIRGANPLLFHGDLTRKKAYEAIVYAKKGGDLGEPEPVHYDLSDKHYDFAPVNGEAPKPSDLKFKLIGFGDIEMQDRVVREGKYALANEKRFGSWSFLAYDLSDYIGQTIEISAWIQSPAGAVSLKVDGNDPESCLATVDTKEGEWVFVKTNVSIPSDVHSMFLRFEPIDSNPNIFSPLYLDELNIHLIGMVESFEKKSNAAMIRGAGHLPFLSVTDEESVDGKSHSLSVTRQEKDATVKFSISPYIGHTIKISAYIKTSDSVIRLGIDTPKKELVSVASNGEWTLLEAECSLEESLTNAEFYIETDGSAQMFIDEIIVSLSE